MQIITLVPVNTFPAPLGDASQATGAVMAMMIVVITLTNGVVLQRCVQNVNSDVWMEVVLLVAGAVMGSVTVEIVQMKQDAVSSLSLELHPHYAREI